MNIEICIVTADKNHLSLLINLGNSYYPIDHPALHSVFLQWYYLDNPVGRAKLIVAKDNELWIGVIVLIPVELECSGQLQNGYYAVNVLTHQNYQGKGIFGKMICYASEILAKNQLWLIGHPNRSAIPGWKHQNMRFRDDLQLYLAKFKKIFSSISEKHIKSLKELTEI